MMISNVKGQFTSLKGVLTLDEANVVNSHGETVAFVRHVRIQTGL
jgi:polyisoprenoid-binding protein YceI